MSNLPPLKFVDSASCVGKLVELDADIRPYLASLMVAAMHKAGDTLVVPDDLNVRPITIKNFEMLLQS